MEFESSWLIVVFALFGVTGAFIAFLKTPPSERFTVFSKAKSIEEQLASYPDSAKAVLIKSRRKKAILNSLPYSSYFVLLTTTTLYIGIIEKSQCAHMAGVSTSLLSLLIFCYGMPAGLLLASLFYISTGVRSIKSGYFPPIESVHFSDTIATKGVFSMIRGWLLIVLPIAALYSVYYGHYVYTVATNDEPFLIINERLKAKCK